MGGRASLLLVIGFGLIFGYINLKMIDITKSAVVHMISYNESAMSRNMANTGAHVGLGLLANDFSKRGLLRSETFTKGPFAGCSYAVRMDSIVAMPLPYDRLLSVSQCTTQAKMAGNPVILSDTVEIRFSYFTGKSFSNLGWMTITEKNVYFVTGDTLWGKVHTNGDMNISGSPVFMGEVTISGKFNPKRSTPSSPTSNKAKFPNFEPQTGMPKKEFPTDLSDLINKATNDPGTRASELWVELKPGTGTNDDGYAIVRTGSFTGTKVDSMPLSGTVDNVIYSNQNIHVKGKLDGRLSIASGNDLKIEDHIIYENEPDPTKPFEDPVNQTTDMLGLIGFNNVLISKDFAGGSTVKADLNLDASIFALKHSFGAEDYNTRAYGGRIRLIGSIAQNERGAIGISGSYGYLKSYRYDTRMDPPSPPYNPNDQKFHPPAFPGFITPGPLTILNWWESFRKPFEIDDYQW